MFLKNETLSGARVWFEEIIRRRCSSEGTEDPPYMCIQLMLDLGMTYLKLEQYKAAEDILLQARAYSLLLLFQFQNKVPGKVGLCSRTRLK